MMASERPAVAGSEATPAPRSGGAAPPTSFVPPPTSRALAGFDLFLAGGVVVLGFLIASFAVKNSDFWQHIAVGRLIANGEYAFGADPFSYSTQGRTWVNHAWLFDLGVYVLGVSKGEVNSGAILVAVKAALAALGVALILLMRPRGYGLWLGVILAGLALLASAPRLLLQPSTLSVLFLTWTLFLLLKRRDSKWLPVYIAVTFVLWVNCDAWFILGPATLLLFTICEMVQGRDDKRSQATRPSLLIVLGVGMAATLLNPHHIQAWQLPPELSTGAWANELNKDRELRGMFFRDAWDSIDFSGDRGGNPLNAYAFIFLIGLSALGMGLNFSRLRWSHVLIWAVFLALAMYAGRLIPFFAVVAAGLGTWNLAEAVERFAGVSPSSASSPILRFLRAGGRALTLLSGVLLLAASPPGWLHSQANHPHLARPIAWSIEPDPSLERASRRIQSWRTSGALPPEAHGLHLHPDLAYYLAWYAPGEKTFFDARLPFHAPEVADFVLVRHTLSMRDNEGKSNKAVGEILEKHGVTHVAISAIDRVDNRSHFYAVIQWPRHPQFATEPKGFNLWSIDGRVTVCGWRGQKAISAAEFDALNFDPVRLAFGPDVEIIKDPDNITRAVDRSSFLDRYLNPPRPPVVEYEEAMLLVEYQQLFQWKLQFEFDQMRQREGMAMLARGAIYGIPGIVLFQNLVVPVPPEATATALLAVRTARRAVAADPDSPDALLALASAMRTPFFRSAEDYRGTVALASLVRALARSSPKVSPRRGSAPMHDIAAEVADMHRRARPPRVDFTKEYLKLAADYLEVAVPTFMTEQDRQAAKEHFATLAAFGKFTADETVARQSDQYENAASRVSHPLQRADLATRYGLHREAILELMKIDRSKDSKVPDPEKARATLQLIGLYLDVGLVEEAIEELSDIDVKLGAMIEDPIVSQSLRQLRMIANYLVGNLSASIREQAEEASRVTRMTRAAMSVDFPTPPVNLERLLTPKDFAPVQALTLLADRLPPLLMALVGDHAGRLFQYRNAVQNEADLHVHLGLVELERGDNAMARSRFEQALKTAGDGKIDFPTKGLATEYLKLLKPEKKPK